MLNKCQTISLKTGPCLNYFTIYILEAKCPGNGDVSIYGDLCQYKCHCRDNEQCDVVTGECISGCALGWMGPGCQYG